jgi:hypothetical protein
MSLCVGNVQPQLDYFRIYSIAETAPQRMYQSHMYASYKH